VDTVTQLTNLLVASYVKAGGINHLDGKNLPSKRVVTIITSDLLRLLFPGFFDEKLIHSSKIKGETAALLESVLGKLEDEIRKSLEYNPPKGLAKKDITAEAHKVTVDFLGSLPRIREVFKARNAQGRRQLLGEMAKIVWFQPEAVHHLLQIAMDDNAETSYEYGFKVTSEQAIRQVPELLAVTIYDEKSSADAFRRLWLLSQSGPEDVRDRARRALKEAIGYKKYKSLSYNARVLSHVEMTIECDGSPNSWERLKRLLARKEL